MSTSTNIRAYILSKSKGEGCRVIVETVKHGECTCHFDDSAYVDRTEEEIEKTIQMFSAFLAECLRKKENV